MRYARDFSSADIGVNGCSDDMPNVVSPIICRGEVDGQERESGDQLHGERSDEEEVESGRRCEEDS